MNKAERESQLEATQRELVELRQRLELEEASLDGEEDARQVAFHMEQTRKLKRGITAASKQVELLGGEVEEEEPLAPVGAPSGPDTGAPGDGAKPDEAKQRRPRT